MPESNEKSGNFLGPIQERIENFKNLDQNQKTIILAAFALVISTLVVLTLWFNRVEYKVLYSDLSDKDASQITKILKEKKIQFKLQEQGRTILVPSKNVHQLRLDLAGEGLPKNGHVGFEIFDKTDFQSSEFAESIKYVRALQGELSTSINKLEAVEESRINLSIPRRRIYMNEDEKPTASVLLKLRRGYKLNNEEIRGIAFLVSGCVEGLKAENVTVMSTDGRLLSDFMQEGALGSSTYQLRIQRDIQKEIEMKVVGLLNQTLGEGKAVVKAHVDLKLDHKEIQKELYQPTKGNVGVIRSSQTLQEDYEEKPEEKKTNNNNNNQNNPNGAATSTTSGASGKPVYGQKSLITNYEISKVVESEKVYPGQIKKISLGVVIDDKTGLKEKQLKSIRDVIASAAGIDKARGDLLTVRVIKFYKKKALPEEPEKKPTGTELLEKYGKYIVPIIAPLLIMAFAGLFLRKKKEEKEELPQLQAPMGDTGLMAGGSPIPTIQGAPTLNVVSDQPTDILGGGPDFDDDKEMEFKEDIQRFAKENPKAAAKLIEQWIHEG